MDSNEIRECLSEARQAGAEAEAALRDSRTLRRELVRLKAANARLVAAAESMLAEREAFAGRLRRTTAAPQTLPPAVEIPVHLSSSDEKPSEATPSPAPDA